MMTTATTPASTETESLRMVSGCGVPMGRSRGLIRVLPRQEHG
jgi:hypothetical protein